MSETNNWADPEVTASEPRLSVSTADGVREVFALSAGRRLLKQAIHNLTSGDDPAVAKGIEPDTAEPSNVVIIGSYRRSRPPSHGPQSPDA